MNQTEIDKQKSQTSQRPRQNMLFRLGNWQTWVSVILLFLTLEIAVVSIERAHWITPQPSLTLILIFSVAAAWLLWRSRLPGIVTHIIALVVGIGMTAWQTYQLSASETVAFAIFLAFLTWIMGYYSTRFILHRNNAWIGVCLGTVIVVINLSNLPDDYYYFFGLFFAVAIGLIVWTHRVKQQRTSGQSTGFSRRSLFYMTTILLCIVILAVSLARIAPDIRVPQIQTFVATKMLFIQDLQDSFFNLFAKVPSKQALSTSSTRRDLPFGSVWKQKDDVDFVIVSPQPSYWRVELYDTYTSQGWSNRPVTEKLIEKNEPWENDSILADGEIITYSVTTNIKTDALLTAGDYVSADTNVLAGDIGGDLISVTMPRVLSPGEYYTVTSRISSPSSEALSQVGNDYPSSVSTQYVRLSSDFPDEIRELSKEITRDTITPYQKVVAIDKYLSQFPYEEEIEAPPEGTDGVSFFLYTQKSGFCLYFASAMVVMLRSVDVPARLAVGYIPGEFGEEEDEYILRNKDYHAWAQVYFTGYGWVDIEATPSTGGSPVSGSTPFVATVNNPVNPPPDIDQSSQALEYWMNLYGIPLNNPETSPVLPQVRYNFAESLKRGLIIFSVIVAILLLLATLRMIFRSAFYRWLWRVDREHLAQKAYSRMCQLAAMVGLEPRTQQTPQEFADELAIEFPDQTAAFNEIVRFYSENRFSPRKGRLGLFDEVTVLKARSNVYRSLLQRLGFLKKIIL